jgi:hypothetical protein
MAKINLSIHLEKPKVSRPGVHAKTRNSNNKKSKNYVKKYRGQGRKPNWALSFGFYPGILFGMRTYEEETQTAYVFYLPFIDVAFEVISNGTV